MSHFLKKILIICLILTSSCSFLGKKEQDTASKKKRINPNAIEKAEESKAGILGIGKKSKGTTYEFATSNVLWRASLETLDFMPLSNLTYSGGVIVTDWYSGQTGNLNEQIKINIRFTSNDISSSSIVVKGFKKECNNAQNCKVSKLSNNFNKKIKDQILLKAKEIKLSQEENQNKK